MATKPDSDFVTESLIELLAQSKIQASASTVITGDISEIKVDARQMNKKVDDLSMGMRNVSQNQETMQKNQGEMQKTLDGHTVMFSDHAHKIDSGKRRIEQIERLVEASGGRTPVPAIEDEDSSVSVRIDLTKSPRMQKAVQVVKHPAVALPGSVALYEGFKEFVLPLLKAVFGHKTGQ